MIEFLPYGTTPANRVSDYVGVLPLFLDAGSGVPAIRQLDANYPHGGGWRNFRGFVLDEQTLGLKYPGDPVMHPLAYTTVGTDKVYVYPYSWVMVLHENGNYEVCRMD